jgi:hypothetical protein
MNKIKRVGVLATFGSPSYTDIDNDIWYDEQILYGDDAINYLKEECLATDLFEELNKRGIKL